MNQHAIISWVVSGLRSGQVSLATLDAAKAIIDSGDSEALLVAFVESHDGSRDPAVVIGDSMASLEGLMNADPKVSGVLMAVLYDRASAAFLYDVCDAIDLWMDSSQSKALAEALRALPAQVKGESDPQLVARWLRWAEGIEARV